MCENSNVKGMIISQCKTRTADCRLGIKCGLGIKRRLGRKHRLGVKGRLRTGYKMWTTDYVGKNSANNIVLGKENKAKRSLNSKTRGFQL